MASGCNRDLCKLQIHRKFVLSRSWRPCVRKYPLVVPSLFPYTGMAIQYILDPSGFMGNCHRQHGPMFKMLIGGQQLIVISSPNGINAILWDQHSIFKGDSMQIELIKEISGLPSGK
ncbi:hypothetical protein BKA82DRAFT_4010514 [Pisolithus tinctorius]|nr:hypothetical protein BKA82DRAFT_4010514 [Pisolithus tinctorius]